jgi:hypothetical protein
LWNCVQIQRLSLFSLPILHFRRLGNPFSKVHDGHHARAFSRIDQQAAALLVWRLLPCWTVLDEWLADERAKGEPEADTSRVENVGGEAMKINFGVSFGVEKSDASTCSCGRAASVSSPVEVDASVCPLPSQEAMPRPSRNTGWAIAACLLVPLLLWIPASVTQPFFVRTPIGMMLDLDRHETYQMTTGHWIVEAAVDDSSESPVEAWNRANSGVTPEVEF